MAGDTDLDSLGLSDDEVRQQYPLIARPAPAMQPVSVRGLNIPQAEPEAPSMMRSATEIPPVTPTVASPLEQQTAKDRTMQSELSRGSGIAQIGNPWARGALRGLNIAGEIGAAAIPELRPVLNAIPGTEEHHQQLLGRNTAALNEDEAQAEKEAQTGEAGARTGLTNAQTTEVPSTIAKNTAEATEANARAEALKNPKPEKPESLEQELADATQDAIARKVLPVDDPKVRQILGVIEAQKPPGEKTPPHVTVMEKDGKPHIMERDPKTGAYSIDRGVAPPNYAQVLPTALGTRTTELLGPDNVMHRYQFNPQTNSYDIDMGAAPTGAAAHQIFQAGAIEQLAPLVIRDINANREILGNLSSYYKQWLSGSPVADPRAAQLMAELMSFAAMQPALHAFRSTNALDAFEKMVGGLAKDPDATIATINGLLKTPEAFTGMGHAKENAAPKAGTVQGGYKFKGGDPSKQENWQKVNK